MAAALPASAQQFVDVPGIFPGPNRWTEGTDLVDVDGDGDLDVLFANGDGFSGPGAKRQNVLLINQLVETGSLSFTDESVARLGANVSHARGFTHGDVNGDGWVDILVANAFNTDVPFLYINQGPAQPGFFNLESAARGFTTAYSSAGAQFGDVDDDGDLDVVLCDSGASYLGGAGGIPVLYRNDGSGNFTLDPAFTASTKVAHMDVQLEDIDLDWDLDIILFCRANNGAQDHYVLLGDGTGAFVEASSVIPSTSASVYEAEVADLDGDLDHDLFFVSLVGFNEGPMQNQVVETGSLDFTAGTALTQGVDDNEIGLIDWDNDGDYDVIVGSLGSNERAYRNNGGLSFAYNANRIQKIGDSTLDLAIGDLDNDGAYDLVTGQGESGGFTNRMYSNTGSPDNVKPQVPQVNLPDALVGTTLVVHARVRDQVRDDSVDYITGSGVTTPVTGNVTTIMHQAGAFSPAVVNIPAGTTIEWSEADGVAQTVTSDSEPFDYDLTLPGNGTVARVFVSAGVYDFHSTVSGATGQIVVGAGAIEASATRLGGEVHRLAFNSLGAENLFAVELFFTDWAGNQRVVDGLQVGRGIGTNYCGPAVNNSSGGPGLIAASGSAQVVNNDFSLHATGLPTSQFGYFLASQSQGFVSGPGGSQGNLCLGSPVLRFVLQIKNSGAGGAFSASLDLTSFPAPYGGAVIGGQTWNFSTWFRDNNPGQTSNFTDGLSVTFL
jgi:plastocyanin